MAIDGPDLPWGRTIKKLVTALAHAQEAKAIRRPPSELPAFVSTLATCVVAFFSVLQFFALIQTNRIAEASERSWIAVQGMEFTGDFLAGKNAPVVVHYENSGHGPAIAVTLYGKINTEPDLRKSSSDPIYDGKNISCDGVEPPEEANVVFPTSHDPRQLTYIPAANMTPGVISGQANVIFKGCFVYKSIGKVRHTAFCYVAVDHGVRATLGATSLCADGNFAD